MMNSFIRTKFGPKSKALVTLFGKLYQLFYKSASNVLSVLNFTFKAQVQNRGKIQRIQGSESFARASWCDVREGFVLCATRRCSTRPSVLYLCLFDTSTHPICAAFYPEQKNRVLVGWICICSRSICSSGSRTELACCSDNCWSWHWFGGPKRGVETRPFPLRHRRVRPAQPGRSQLSAVLFSKLAIRMTPPAVIFLGFILIWVPKSWQSPDCSFKTARQANPV